MGMAAVRINQTQVGTDARTTQRSLKSSLRRAGQIKAHVRGTSHTARTVDDGENLMAEKFAITAAELRGLSKLGFAAAIGVTDLVEQMHNTIARVPLPVGPPLEGRARGVAGFVYRCVRGAMLATGAGVDFAFGLAGASPKPPPSRARAVALAALNGVVGDRLAATGNALALEMHLRVEGRELPEDGASLATALPDARGRILVLVHGLCLCDWQWTRKQHDHGAALARDGGMTAVYLSYNSGLHISQNGRAFAEAMERLVANWPTPVDEIVIVGHSMGGLVARSAVHYARLADHDWTSKVRKMAFLGSPHHGAPLERIGSWVERAIRVIPYVAAFGRLGKVRSAGITDLRHGLLVDEDWRGRDRFEGKDHPRASVPLPGNVACYAIAATTAETIGGARDQTIGDGLVQVDSALGRSRDAARRLPIPDSRRAIVCATGHLDLLSSQEVYALLRDWLAPA